MYILVLLWDDKNLDVFIGLEWFDTLSCAVAEGNRRCTAEDDNFQIWKPIPCSTEMELISEEEYPND